MSELTLVIGNKNYSSWSLRPWLALRHTGQAFREVVIPLYEGDSKARILEHSPAGKVPVLRHGDVTVWDSLAICEYLAETFPEAGLWPQDKAARAMARSVSAEMHAGFAALRANRTMNVMRTPQVGPETPEIKADITRIQELWQACRDRFGEGGPFLFGRFSVADAMYAPVAVRFTTYRIAMTPAAKAYVEAIWSLPAMQDWKRGAAGESWRLAQFE